MIKMTYKLQQNLIFFMLNLSTLQANDVFFDKFVKQWRTDQEIINEEKIINDDDEQLLIDLSIVASDFYKEIIKITMLYFTGMLQNSDQFHKQLLLEISKHVLYAGQIFAQHLSKLLKNPKIPWKIKIKSCAYVSSYLIIMVIWMKEFYNPNNDLNSFDSLPANALNFNERIPHFENFSHLEIDEK